MTGSEDLDKGFALEIPAGFGSQESKESRVRIPFRRTPGGAASRLECGGGNAGVSSRVQAVVGMAPVVDFVALASAGFLLYRME